MSRRAYFRFYPREFFEDTLHLSSDAQMAYLKLLSHQFTTGKGFKMDWVILSKITGLSTRKLRVIYPDIARFFVLEDGLYYNKKMALEIDQVIEKSKKSSKAAHKRWDANAHANASANAHATNDQLPMTNTKEEEGKSTKKQTRPKKFKPPTLEQVRSYCKERNSPIDPDYFYNHYSSTDWMSGANQIRNWKNKLINWETKEKDYGKNKSTGDSESLSARARRKNADYLKSQGYNV